MTKQNEQEALGTAMNKTEMFFEKNSKSMIIALLALFVLAAAIFGYRQLISQPRERKAAEMIAQAQYRFESTTPEYQLALEGDANGPGFLDVIDQYGSTRAGNLAKHYAGICYLRLGDLDNAAAYLAKYKPAKGIPAEIVNAQNIGLQGDIAVEKGDYAAAIKLYEKKEHRVVELDSKIDQLYAEKNEDRQRIRELIEKNTTLEIEKIKLEAKRCDVRGCSGRKPPSDY